MSNCTFTWMSGIKLPKRANFGPMITLMESLESLWILRHSSMWRQRKARESKTHARPHPTRLIIDWDLRDRTVLYPQTGRDNSLSLSHLLCRGVQVRGTSPPAIIVQREPKVHFCSYHSSSTFGHSCLLQPYNESSSTFHLGQTSKWIRMGRK